MTTNSYRHAIELANEIKGVVYSLRSTVPQWIVLTGTFTAPQGAIECYQAKNLSAATVLSWIYSI